MSDERYKPFFPKERREERGELIVIREEMTPEMRKQRREDNKTMKRIRATNRGRRKHGQTISKKPEGTMPWLAKSKQMQKQKRQSEKSQNS